MSSNRLVLVAGIDTPQCADVMRRSIGKYAKRCRADFVDLRTDDYQFDPLRHPIEGALKYTEAMQYEAVLLVSKPLHIRAHTPDVFDPLPGEFPVVRAVSDGWSQSSVSSVCYSFDTGFLVMNGRAVALTNAKLPEQSMATFRERLQAACACSQIDWMSPTFNRSVSQHSTQQPGSTGNAYVLRIDEGELDAPKRLSDFFKRLR